MEFWNVLRPSSLADALSRLLLPSLAILLSKRSQKWIIHAMPQNSLSSRIFDKRLAANVKYSSSLFDFEQMMLSMASGVCFNLIEPTASILKSINKIIQFHHFRNFCTILKSLYIFSSTDCRDDSLGHKIFSSIITF